LVSLLLLLLFIPLKIFFGAGDWTQGLMHARHMLTLELPLSP
jgi:hypothetical protein